MTARAARAARGFTLVEVLVALFILAILSGMAFRGVDAIVRAKDRALAESDRTLKVNTGMSQFEYDASQMVNTQVVDPIGFDGATLRITRRTPAGLQLVLWTLQEGRWQRWASPPMTRISQMQEAWLRSQQWNSISANAVTVLDHVDAFQVYTYCLGGGWGNVQSSCGGGPPPSQQQPPPSNNGTPPPPPGGASGAGGGGPGGSGSGNNNVQPPGQGGTFPTGIRIQLSLPEGQISREKELPAL